MRGTSFLEAVDIVERKDDDRLADLGRLQDGVDKLDEADGWVELEHGCCWVGDWVRVIGWLVPALLLPTARGRLGRGPTYAV